MPKNSRLKPLASAVLRTQTDDRLVALCRDGKEAAFEEIVRRYRSPLVAFAAAYGPPDPEDVVQESLIRSWDALRDSTGEMHLKAWLYTIVRNRSLNARRDSRSHEPLTEEIDGVPQPPEVVLTKDELDRAVAAVTALPPAQREALVRNALEGHTHAQIAASIGSTSGAVRQLIYRARIAVRHGVGVVIPLPVVAALAELGAGSAGVAASAAGGAAVAGGGSAASKAAIVAAVGVVAAGSGVAIERSHESDDSDRRRTTTQQQNQPASAPPTAAVAAVAAVAPGSGSQDGSDPGSSTSSGDGEAEDTGDRGGDDGRGESGSDSSGPGPGRAATPEDSSGPGSGLDSSGSGSGGTSGSSGSGSSGSGSPGSESSGSGSSGSGSGDDSSGSGSGGSDDDDPEPVDDDSSGPGGGSSGDDSSGSSGSGSGDDDAEEIEPPDDD